ncbi:MAG: DUF1553 domain-containing protein, partial [Verrucomicrobiota bacterium]
WRSFYGRGIVQTAGDLGYQSEFPSHPHLIDYLADEWVDRGSSMKKLHKRIVTSRTYQQSSDISSEAYAKDPKNIWLARGPRFRMSGEMIRDSALATSGLLVEKVGGPSVYPPQLQTVTDAAYGKTKWNVSKGDNRYRRSLYTFAKRTAPFAAYLSFDGPTGESCLARRERSNTPLQALTLLNDEMFTEVAAALAVQLTGEPEQVIDALFQRILSRPPEADEVDAIMNFYHQQLSRIGKGELKLDQLIAQKDATPEQAAWAMVVRALYNLDEAITKG